MSKLFQCFISHVTTSEKKTELKLFQPLKEFWDYFKIIISAERNMLMDIRQLQWACEIISGKLIPRADIKPFPKDVDEGRNNVEIALFHM